MISKRLPLSAAMAAVGLLGAGSANASFILGPFQVSQSATLQSNSSLGAPVTVGPGATPQTLNQIYFGPGSSLSAHGASVPDGNRAFFVTAGSTGTVPSADTVMNYDFDFTNTSATAFTGRLRFFLYGLSLNNTCTAGALCSTTDPNAKSGAEIRISTTLPGGGGTVSTSQFEMGLNGSTLNVLADNLGIAPHMQLTKTGVSDLVGGPIGLIVDLGTVLPGQTVHIDYDSRNYVSAADGLCNPPPLISEQLVCDEFSQSGSGLEVCISSRVELVSIPQPPVVCTNRSSQFLDPLETGSVGMELVAASVNVPVPASIGLLGAGALGLGLGLRLTRRRDPAQVR